MISGKDFKNYCRWNLCNRYEVNFNIHEIKENDFIFITTDLIRYVYNILNNLDFKVNLIFHNSDSNFTDDLFNLINKHNVYAINSVTNKVKKIPLGFGESTLDYIHYYDNEKINLAYCNFSIDNNSDRKICYDFAKEQEWIDKKLVKLNTETLILSLPDYFNTLSTYKYNLCPRGVGIDTHRIYECIYYNVIPIVKKNELSDMYLNMPILLIDNWHDLDLNLLNNKYDELFMNLINWKNENKNWYKPEYWL